jgi:hypothetical protein
MCKDPIRFRIAQAEFEGRVEGNAAMAIPIVTQAE